MIQNTVKFIPTFFEVLDKLRGQYIESLPFSQELHFEWLVCEGACFLITSKRKHIGYFIKSNENQLLEFYVTFENISKKEYIFQQVIEQHTIHSALCKSFDELLMTCCHTFCKSSSIMGYLFRFYSDDVVAPLPNNILCRIADKSDIPLLLSYDSELYETPEELNFTVSNQMVYIYELAEELIGCGYLIKILPANNYYDVGMWVNPKYRKQGYATIIISHLKKMCLEAGYIPIAGCAAENEASRKTLEKCGFTTKHCAIIFQFQ